MKKLPVIGTTAPTTTFCAQLVDGPDGTSLYIDGNQKITRDNGTYDAPMPNAFSLEAQAVANMENTFGNTAGADCPGSTPTCRKSCYVHGLSKHAGDTYDLYRHNSAEIRRILADDKLANEWAVIMAAWITENAAGGFRWHVSGDVFSPAYAAWIADVCSESPTVDHWIYTRSFDANIMAELTRVSIPRGGNLALNLSCDKDNYDRAFATAQAYGGEHNGVWQALRLCYLVEKNDPRIPADLPQDSVIFPDYDLRPKSLENPQDMGFWKALTMEQRTMLCPVDSYGKSEKIRCGPCVRCLL